jgi:L-2,4-diaminobutyric acid acetyltransferase
VNLATHDAIRTRGPRATDGRAVHALVREAGGLERNTGYAYVLLCDHFADTGVVAERDGRLVGFVAAYRPPSDPDAVFVWQVGVHPSARGQGLGRRLLDAVLQRPGSRGARFLTATVAPSNAASRRLFQGFARRRGAPFTWSDGYAAHLFAGGHEPEPLIRIGPMTDAPETSR